jgi:Subtilase family
MRRATAVLVAIGACAALAGPAAGAAKKYNDPWLEGDLQQMRVPEALGLLTRAPRIVVVGDVDSGARLNDPDLAPHLLRMPKPYTCTDEYGPGPSYAATPAKDFGCDWIGSGSEAIPSTVPDGDPTDPFGHGTGTAAIIAAVANNGLEGAGVAPNARVLPVRACYGGNPDCYNEPAADGLQYAITMGARVINASWPPEGLSPAIYSIVHKNANVLFDFAIGGTGQNSTPYPLCTDKAKYPNVVCVGLANADDSVGTDDANTTTDVSAPGYAGVPTASGTRGEFGYTSGATAHVTGAAALLRGVAPDLSASQIRTVLVTTSRHVAGYATANRAKGIVDVATAVRKVQELEAAIHPPARTTTFVSALVRALAPTGPAAKVTTLLRVGAYAATVNAPGAGTAKISWYSVPKGAHIARKTTGSKTLLVAAGTRKFAKKGKGKIQAKLTRSGRALLKKVERGHRLGLTAKGSFAPKGAKTVTRTKAFSLKR